jgi:hypothetical protein
MGSPARLAEQPQKFLRPLTDFANIMGEGFSGLTNEMSEKSWKLEISFG